MDAGSDGNGTKYLISSEPKDKYRHSMYMACSKDGGHTWKNTNLGDSALGSCLNLEIDMLARYVSRLMQVAGEIK